MADEYRPLPRKSPYEMNEEMQKLLRELIDSTDDPKIRKQAERQLKLFQRQQKHFKKP